MTAGKTGHRTGPDLAGLGLDDLVRTAWSLLARGVRRSGEAFHTPTLATASPDGPTQRTVVLRDADPVKRRLSCHTDRRSPKVADLAHDDRACWLFYDRGLKLQLRMTGRLSLHSDDAYADERWATVTPRGRACYLAVAAPGDAVEHPSASAPGEDRNIRAARARFAVLACRIETLDWLYLSGTGHRRARFVCTDGHWTGGWVAP